VSSLASNLNLALVQKLLPSPRGPRAGAHKSRENSQKIQARHGKSPTPNVGTPSITSVNESVDRPESTLVDQDSATSQGHLPLIDHTGDARSGPRALSDLRTSDPVTMERPETGPSTPVVDTPTISTPSRGGVEVQIPVTVPPPSPGGPSRRKGWFRKLAEDVLHQLGVEVPSDDHSVPSES
jgi:hypothetical protein